MSSADALIQPWARINLYENAISSPKCTHPRKCVCRYEPQRISKKVSYNPCWRKHTGHATKITLFWYKHSEHAYYYTMSPMWGRGAVFVWREKGEAQLQHLQEEIMLVLSVDERALFVWKQRQSAWTLHLNSGRGVVSETRARQGWGIMKLGFDSSTVRDEALGPGSLSASPIFPSVIQGFGL